MKKTILKVIILAFFILLHKNTVYAGETTFFMEVNEPPQDALIIGRVSEVHNNQNYISMVLSQYSGHRKCDFYAAPSA